MPCLVNGTAHLAAPSWARGSVPGGIKWIFYNRDTVLEGVPAWGGRAVRAHGNLADNLAIYAAATRHSPYHRCDQRAYDGCGDGAARRSRAACPGLISPVFLICERRYSRSRSLRCSSMSGKPICAFHRALKPLAAIRRISMRPPWTRWIGVLKVCPISSALDVLVTSGLLIIRDLLMHGPCTISEPLPRQSISTNILASRLSLRPT